MKNKLIVILTCAFLITIATTGAFASKNLSSPEIPRNVPAEPKSPSIEQITKHGQEIKNLKKGPLAEKPIVKINDKTITAADIELSIKNAKLHGKKLSKEDVVNNYILKQAVAAEAKKLNIYPSENETERFIEKTKEKIKNDEKIYKDFLAEIEGRGISEQEYFESNFEGYRDLLAAFKLKEHVAQEKDLKEKDPTEANKIYSEYLDQLVKNAEYEIVNEEYIENS